MFVVVFTQKAEIEDLVDELYEKLRKIENQNNSDTDNHYLESVSDIEKNCESTKISEDPTKRYYTAFPPLSKEISDANFIKAQMSLTWPAGSTHQLNCNSANNGLTGVKRKPKRRRSQGMTKNKQNFIKKTASTGGVNGGGNGGVGDVVRCKKDNSSLWDTNFEGSWEMGHDLIREFIIKQNNNRNRSISESDASNFADLHHFVHSDKKNNKLLQNINNNNLIMNEGGSDNQNNNEEFEERHLIDFNNEEEINDQQNDDNFIEEFSQNSMSEMSDTSVLMFGNNPIRDEGYVTPDTLTSISEITDSSINGACPRRLYERETSIESINEFKAKFNSSVEALWGDGGGGGVDDEQQLKQPNDLNSFWSKYHKHEYKTFDDTTTVAAAQKQNELNNCSPIIDALEQFRKNISGGLLFSMLDSNSTNSKIGKLNNNNLQQKSNDFIQAGTNITSSIWSSDCGDGAGIWGDKSTDIKLEVSFIFI